MSHTLTLPSGDQLHYQLERRQRRTVGLKITATGLVIHAPKRISQSHLESLIVLKADWIRKKLDALRANHIPPLQWQDGEQLLLLGNTVTLALRHDVRSRAVEYAPGVLHLAMPNHNEAPAVTRKVMQWYKKQALADFSRRLALFSTKLGCLCPLCFCPVPARAGAVATQKKKYGSTGAYCRHRRISSTTSSATNSRI